MLDVRTFGGWEISDDRKYPFHWICFYKKFENLIGVVEQLRVQLIVHTSFKNVSNISHYTQFIANMSYIYDLSIQTIVMAKF